MHDLEVGETLDRYRLTELVARGGMADVWKAVEEASGEELVLKVPFFEYESDVVFHQRFLREEEILLKVRHPSIVRARPAGEKSRLYLVMEYVPGRTLAQELAACKPFDSARALHIARQLAEALAELEANGVVHRDVKPDNVQLMPSGELKLLDFGIALLEAARRLTWARLSHAVGTPDYMAPEQIRGRRGDARTDVYALGTILYEMLTGHLPHEALSTRAVLRSKLHGEPTPPSRHLPLLDPALAAILMRSLARDPRDRYAGPREMLEHLRSPAEALVPVERLRAPAPPGRRRRALAAALVVGALLAGLGSLVWLSGPPAARGTGAPPGSESRR
ncbi:MAG TPA: serine/threonine-protein kinase [Anaeromyxobacter sp.]|nr:serine/threonine-protein kinase [Anaeromyxobacter sp.]